MTLWTWRRWFEELDRLAQELLGMSGEEFLQAEAEGSLPDNKNARHLAVLAPFARRGAP